MRPRWDIFKEIERGEWTHIYLGPEMIMHESFGGVLKSERFKHHFRYFAVDEAHLILEWAEFRAAFLEIEQLQSRFGSKIAWLALSATVEPKLEYPTLVRRLGFDLERTTVLRLPVDRQNITIAPRFLQYPISDTEFLDFAWAVPLSAVAVADIPVTAIFMDTIKQVVNLKTYLTHLLPTTIREPVRSQVVKSITGMMSVGHNTGAVNDVRDGGSTRILVCTDAGALGIDIPQIEQVAVLVEKGSTYRMVCQKLGRMRTSGLGVVYSPRWMSLSRTNASDVSQRAEVEPVILEFANSSVDRCPRAVNVGHWGDPHVPFDRGACLCCNKHNPGVDTTHLEDVRR